MAPVKRADKTKNGSASTSNSATRPLPEQRPSRPEQRSRGIEQSDSPLDSRDDTSKGDGSKKPIESAEKSKRNIHVTQLRLMFAAWKSHFKSVGYIKDATMDSFDRTVCNVIVELTVRDHQTRETIGTEPLVWGDLVDLFQVAYRSLEERCYGAGVDAITKAYEGPSSSVIVSNSISLLKDLQRIDNILSMSRNVLSVGEKVQNMAAQVGFDREVCSMIKLCIKITARSYDGDGAPADEDKWQRVINGFKRLLITSLQFLNNLVTLNERLKLMLWVELFDRSVEEPSSNPIYSRKENAPSEDDEIRQKIIEIPTPFQIYLHLKKDDIYSDIVQYNEGRDPPVNHVYYQAVVAWGKFDEYERSVYVEMCQNDNDPHREEVWKKAKEDPINVTGKHETMLYSDFRWGNTNRDSRSSPEQLNESSLDRKESDGQVVSDLFAPLLHRAVDYNAMDSAADGARKLQEGKSQLLKRLESAPAERNQNDAIISPASPVRSSSESGSVVSLNKDERSQIEREEKLDDDDDELDDEEEGEEEEEDDDDEEEGESSDDDDYGYPGEDGRGLLTDVPLILGPNEIEVLPLIIMGGIVPPAKYTPTRTPDGDIDDVVNMYTIRCHLLLAQENGRNLLRELLIFVAAWDLREEELFFKYMFQIMEAILLNGLIPYAYGAFKESKDVISPAQAVMMKILTKVFHARQGYCSGLSAQSLSRYSQDNTSTDPSTHLRYDIQVVHCLFCEFRQNIIPQICALIFLQGQIRHGYAHLEEFPLNLWDMERMYEGVYQYLEFFAILTDHESWKEMMADWEVTSELVTLLRELEVAIPKTRLTPPTPATKDTLSTRPSDTQQTKSQLQPQSQYPPPVAVERPFDPVSNDGTQAVPNAAPEQPPQPEPLHDEPADFEWRNLKKLCVLVLSSLVWKNKRLQDQVRQFGGVTAVLSCCGFDEHNPFIRDHAIMCLRFLVEGNEENYKLVHAIEEASDQGMAPQSGLQSQVHGGGEVGRWHRAEASALGGLAVPAEVLDHQGYETYMDSRGQVGLRRKDAGGLCTRNIKGIDPIPEWMQLVTKASK